MYLEYRLDGRPSFHIWIELLLTTAVFLRSLLPSSDNFKYAKVKKYNKAQRHNYHCKVRKCS